MIFCGFMIISNMGVLRLFVDTYYGLFFIFVYLFTFFIINFF
jgi:hypothetical protein